MVTLHETKDFSVVRPWPAAGLRIYYKTLGHPVEGTGSYYDLAEYPLPAIDAAIDDANEFQRERGESSEVDRIRTLITNNGKRLDMSYVPS